MNSKARNLRSGKLIAKMHGQESKSLSDNPTVEMKVKASAWSYGALCEAGIALGVTPERALGMFLNQGNAFLEWRNQGFPV